MDIVTHGLLGALTAMAVCRHRPMRQAAVCGAVGGLLPDVDVFIQSSTDPLLVLEYHRGFTHSLAFAPLGALLATLLLGGLFAGAGRLRGGLGRQLTWPQIYALALVGYVSAVLLDACTSYGTHLVWPFTDNPVSLSIIAVMDPLFSITLLFCLAAALVRQSLPPAWLGLALAAGYLITGFVQHGRAEAAAWRLAEQRQLQPTRIIVKPTMGNILLWRALTVAEHAVWADAVRTGILAPVVVYGGEQAALIDPHSWGALPAGSRSYQDLQRFYGFADQLLVTHPDEPNLLGDARYAMLPTSTVPLWGIVLDPAEPETAVQFVTRREFSPAMRQQFMNMLRGAGGVQVHTGAQPGQTRRPHAHD